MNVKELEKNYQQNKDKFHRYIDDIKKTMKVDIYSIINPTIIKNPYASSFPKSFFMRNFTARNKPILFIKSIIKFYIKNIFLLASYVIALIIYKLYYKKKRNKKIENIIDIFVLVDKVSRDKEFNESYLAGLYKVYEKYNIPYTILIRPYGINKNPFKLKFFFKIMNEDKRDLIFEYEFLNFIDFIKLLFMISIYPFKILRLLQKENSIEDKIFNKSLIYDMKYFSFESLIRYLLGKKLSKNNSIKKIYSWSEFQVIERSFNYAIRLNNNNIVLNGCQFYVMGETYFNTVVDDIDYIHKTSFHNVFVNGRYYLQDRKFVKYKEGVALRYDYLYGFKLNNDANAIVLLGSYMKKETNFMLNTISSLDSVIFKSHPAIDLKELKLIPKNVTISQNKVEDLLKKAKLVLSTESGTLLEAVACGVSVIVIASQDNLTANPLVEYGKGKIWDIAFSKNNVKKVYNKLLKYREQHMDEIKEISSWYKDNFFTESTEEKIVSIFL